MKSSWSQFTCAVLTCGAMVSVSACTSEPEIRPQSTSRSDDVVLLSDTVQAAGAVPANTTLDLLLRDHGLSSDGVVGAVDAIREVFDPRRLRTAQPFALVRTIEGALRRFEYEINGDEFLRVMPRLGSTGEVFAEVLPIPKTLEHAVVAGVIGESTPSLYQAMSAAGETPELTIALAAIFAGEFDFNTEVRLNDRFVAAFEKYTRDGHAPSYGTVLAAEYQNDGRLVRAIRFTPPGTDQAGYYDDQGRSLKRFFLRSPLAFEPRITSGFSKRRFHPVTGGFRPHLGVDYGAPTGTPVLSVADGRVVSATTGSANGRMVRLQHTGGYQTYYLHLSAFGAGIRAGARVTQGQVIGKVGSSGLATGPHLDYRVRKDGTFVNPLTEHRKMPPGDPIPASAMAAFEVERDRALAQLSTALASLAPAPAVFRAD